jgi:hypothetical protein
MKLISCENCGVVIDTSRIEWQKKDMPTEKHRDSYDDEPQFVCPGCGQMIFLIDGDC